MKIAFVTTGLQAAGAESMLLKLLEHIDRSRFRPNVVSLTSEGELGPRIRALGIPLTALGMRPARPDPLALPRLALELRRLRVDIVQTWMYHADLLGGLAARLAGVRSVVWSIRNTNLDAGKTKALTRIVVAACSRLSRYVPEGIISCSEAARDVHVAHGYVATKIHVIPNGFDLSSFRPDPRASLTVRAELGLRGDTPLVGIVGRNDPLKNHTGFIEAAGHLHRARPDAHFVLVGRGLDARNLELQRAAHKAGVADMLHWLGQRDDIPRLMAALDVLASSSFGEAFPNVIGEAMACGVPCVVTDVGDSAAIVGDTGRVVAPGDMRGLAEGLAAILAAAPQDRARRGAQARQRIQDRYEIGHVTRRYETYYQAIARTGARVAGGLHD